MTGGAHRAVRFLLVACVPFAACDRPPAKARSSVDTAAFAQARATVEQRYAAHWRAGQSFSRDTLRARASWFTRALYELMLADMAGDEIGIVDYDPFTEAQDDAARYAVGAARASHDTLYIPVDVQFASGSERNHTVTLAMVRDASHWKIADFIDGDGSLAAKLRASLPR